VFYLVSPVDLIPDLVPLFGVVDDLVVDVSMKVIPPAAWAAPCVADRDHPDEARGQFPQYEVTGGKFPLTMPA